jgi:radical SAM protein
MDFDHTPFTVIWEVTRACALRCVHCRADAQQRRDPRELTTAEGIALLDHVRDLGSPVFVITGGDPLQRPDLFDLIAHAVRRLPAVAVTPSGTPLLTREAVHRFADLGVRRMALSLDGSTAAIHDGFRRQPGSFAWTTAGVGYARECELPVQINTTVTRNNLDDLPAIARRIEELGTVMWACFFLVTVGRARAADQLTAQEFEDVFAMLYELSQRTSFAVRTTAAPHYRRYVLQQETAAKRAGVRNPAARVAGMVGDMPRARHGVTDGTGLVFISHTGDVFPSGFLPIKAGNVRAAALADLYRDAPIFRQLRDTDSLQGKCGVCEFRNICAGSRARAYAVSGNPLGEEPLCVYEPRRSAAA